MYDQVCFKKSYMTENAFICDMYKKYDLKKWGHSKGFCMKRITISTPAFKKM